MLSDPSCASGIAAATMFMPETENELSETQLRVAFDGDAVLFSDESEIIVKQHGLDTFFEHEKEFENKPLAQVTVPAPLPLSPPVRAVVPRAALAALWRLANAAALSGPLKVFLGGPGEAPEEVLRQKRAHQLPHPHFPRHGPQRRQFRRPRPEDPA